MFHIINAFLNPFTQSQLSFQFSITVISTLNFFIFANILKEKFSLDQINSYLLSSILLILPCFRASAFWGITENFGWLFLLLAIKFYIKLNNLITIKSLDFKTLFFIFLTCFFSSLALYTRQYMIFFTLFILLDILIIKQEIKLFFIFLFIFLLFSIPGLLLINLWGGLYDVANFPTDNFKPLDTHSPKNFFLNLPFLFNFYAFYLIPFLIIEIKHFGLKSIINKYFKVFFVTFVLMLFFNFFGFFDYMKNIQFGGGVFLKIDYFIFEKKLIFFLLMTSVGLSIIYEIIKQNYKLNLTLFATLLIFCFPKFIYHEYYEPLIIFTFFLLFKHNVNYLFSKNINFSIFIIISYYFSYLLGAVYFRYYLFPNQESWLMFIQS